MKITLDDVLDEDEGFTYDCVCYDVEVLDPDFYDMNAVAGTKYLYLVEDGFSADSPEELIEQFKSWVFGMGPFEQSKRITVTACWDSAAKENSFFDCHCSFDVEEGKK